MDFDNIESLSESEIQDLYNNEIYENNEELAACPGVTGSTLGCYAAKGSRYFVSYRTPQHCYVICGKRGIGWSTQGTSVRFSSVGSKYYNSTGVYGVCYGNFYCNR